MEFLLPPPELPPKRATSRTSTEPLLNPFTILIDTAEQHPFTFQGLHADSDRGNRLLRVIEGINLRRHCLGRHPVSLGDYSVEGMVGRVHVERKSMADCHSTILGWQIDGNNSHRERFEQELANLGNCECAAVVVECSLGELLAQAPEWDQGQKTALLNAKILERSIISFQQRFQVPWLFCDDRRAAEVITFRWLERFWRHNKPKKGRKAR